MSNLSHEAKSTLDTLIETCKDGQYGFEVAAKGVGDPALRAELLQYSLQRREFASALQQALRTMGEKPLESGSLSGTMHRGWIKVKEAISSADEGKILAECERGEDSAVDAYRDAMGQIIPPGIDDLVETQFAAIQHVHDRIKALRDSTDIQ